MIATPASEARLRDRHDLDAPAIVVHTSGTSGTPKAIELTYGNWLWSALGSAVALGLDPAERWLCALPLSHVGGLSIVMRSAIYATTAIVHERFDTDRVLDALMHEDGPTIVSLVPTTLQRLLDAGLREPPALRWALLGGAPATTALQGRAAAAGVPVATDLRPDRGVLAGHHARRAAVLHARADGAATARSSSAGRRWRGGRDRIGRCSPPATWASGAPTARCASPGARPTRSSPAARTWRPAEVEAVLEAHPDVVEAAVHGRADPEWGEAVVATVVADPERRGRGAARVVRGARWRRSRCPRTSPSRWRCRARRRARSHERTCR